MTGFNPEAFVGAGVALEETGDEGIGGVVGTGLQGTSTGSEIVWTAPGNGLSCVIQLGYLKKVDT